MSLNCLSCQLLQRSDSERERGQQKYFGDQFESSSSSERSWSGNLTLRPYDRQEAERGGFRLLAEKKVAPKGHRRLHSTGAVSFCGAAGKEPRLVRSSGMRRDWSFEDLRTIRDEKKASTNS